VYFTEVKQVSAHTLCKGFTGAAFLEGPLVGYRCATPSKKSHSCTVSDTHTPRISLQVFKISKITALNLLTSSFLLDVSK